MHRWLYFWSGFIACFALSWASACGGGSSGDVPLPVSPRYDTLGFGYYNANGDAQLVADHATIWMESGWTGAPGNPGGGVPAIVAHLALAKALGINRAILAVNFDPAQLAYTFDQLQSASLLDMVVALYIGDELDLTPFTDAQIVAGCAIVRQVASRFPELANVALASIWSASGRRPGQSALNWVGVDKYGSGPQMVPLLPGQRLLIVAGGSDPWRESAQVYVDFGLAHSEVIAVIAFLCEWPQGEPGGICNNGMLPSYRAAALGIPR